MERIIEYISSLDSVTYIIIAAFLLISLICIIVAAVMSKKAAKARRQYAVARSSFDELAAAVAHLVDSKDKFALGHSKRVANITVAIGKQMKYPELDKLYAMALLHDIGNIAIPDSILLRNGRLGAEEFAVMMTHTDIGAEYLDTIKSAPYLSLGAKYHHEHFDGTGYNYCLEGDDIPLEGRIIGVAEAYDAMTSKRSYRDGLSVDKSIEELRRCSGTQFDPAVAQALIKALSSGFNPNADMKPKR